MPTSADLIYLDSSALVKLVAHEPESPALWRYLRSRRRRTSCAIARVEVVRAVRHLGTKMVSRARRQLADLEVIRVDDALLDDAAELDPIHLRTLDALHIAAARALGPSLGMFVTYDARLAVAAGSVGLRVVAPR